MSTHDRSSRVHLHRLTLHPPPSAELREKIKNQIQEESPGGWAAWKAAKLAKKYEEAGGGYEDTGDNENKAKKGTPEPKPGVKKAAGGAAQTQKREKREREGEEVNQTEGDDGKKESAKDEAEKPKSKSKQSKTQENGDVKEQGDKKTESTAKEKKSTGNGASKTKKEQKPPAKGTRTQPSRSSKK